MTQVTAANVRLRAATDADWAWLTESYQRLDFVASDPKGYYIVIAERDGERAGAGRLVRTSDATELGGIFVNEKYRGLGVSRLIVGHLVNRGRDETLFCIPFAKLSALYASFGFRPSEPSAAPESIAKKFHWCAKHYAEEVRLMRRDPDR